MTDESFQVSPQQEQLWLETPEGPSGRIQAVVSLSGPIDPAAVPRALDSVVARHEILRTTFVRHPGIRVPLQVVRDELPPVWETVDLTAQPAAQQDDRIALLAARELRAPIDFASASPVRAVLIARADARQTLILTLSSLSADAASAALLVAELAHHLNGAGTLTDEPLQYADFAAWQRELHASDDAEALAARQFWQGLDDDAGRTGPALPFARSTTVAPIACEPVPVALDGPLAANLSTTAAEHGATLEALAHAAWCTVLARSAGAEEATVAFVGTERRHADLDGAIGALSRSVPLSTGELAGITFPELLQGLTRARADSLVWQDYAPADGRAGFATGFVAAAGASVRAGGTSVELERVLDTGRGFALALTCTTGDGEPRLELCFDPECHDRESVERLGRRLERTLQAVAADPGQAVAAIDLLDDAERHRVLVAFNGTSGPVPAARVHELFAHHAAASPSRPAAIDEHGQLTYAELDARANQLANRLRASAAGSSSLTVGLCTDRSNEMLVGLLGILKAGGAYVPLHHEHPPARLAQQLETAGATAIVTQEPLLAQLPDFAGEIVCLDRDRASLDDEPVTAPEAPVETHELAYVIYTSGSTGTPKGVGVTHAALVNYATFIAARLGADREPLAFGLVTSISTDLGNTSVFGALCSGGTLVLISPALAADSERLAAQLDTTRLDVLKITPSHAGALLAGRDPRVLPRRWLVLGGERAPWDLVERVRSLSRVQILNHYGPTETTVGSCTFVVPDAPGEYAPASVPIGEPIANTQCYVLDDRLAPVPLGAPGRLFIAGAGVARGYVGQPELTAERFVENPFSDHHGDRAGTRMYDTGDVARWLPDGALEFLGRVDEQVKVRGYRVELGEVEAVLRKHPLVTEAAVIARPGATGDLQLAAYCQVSGPADSGELRAHLQSWLPEFMVPATIAVLDALPQTPSGKIDRLALPDPDVLGEQAVEYVAPSTPLEQSLAAIWCAVLGLERVGAHDDFFTLGGHSLLATHAVVEVRSELAVDLPLYSLFEYPTVASLAAEIVRLTGEDEDEDTAALRAELDALSDEEAERLLAGEGGLPEPDQQR